MALRSDPRRPPGALVPLERALRSDGDGPARREGRSGRDGTARGDGAGAGQVAEIQRVRMLAAALHAIDRNGCARFTVSQVIARAKVSRKTFYDVFEDREDCFVALFAQGLERAGERAGAACAAQDGWREGVRAGLAEMLRFIEEEPLLARLCVVEALAAGPRVLELRDRALVRLQRTIERGAQAGTRAAGLGDCSAVTAEGTIGAVFAIIYARLLERSSEPYLPLLGPLMSMIVLPYLGGEAAARELRRPPPRRRASCRRPRNVRGEDPLSGLEMRLTYRTVSVLEAIAKRPGASNREVADRAGIADQGQVSKLLSRLERLELVRNVKQGRARGAPNGWRLTRRGAEVERATRPL
jgi:AcrR family transcriptional regulator